MLLAWWTLVLLLLAETRSQSGDGDGDTEPRISCTSHITMDRCSLTCKLETGGTNVEDDEDMEADGIQKMTVCYTDWTTSRISCEEDLGDTVSSRDLSPLLDVNVTAHLKRGGNVTTTVTLKNIVKPRSPQVWNVTFNQELNQAVIHIRTPYYRDILNVDNQLFQLQIWSTGSLITQNVSSSDSLIIDMGRLQKDTEYHVKVRAILRKYLQGTWSDWSESVSFVTPAEDDVQQQRQDRWETYMLTCVCLVPLLVVTTSAVFFWKKIFSFVCPNVPHPKHTLLHICKPSKGLLLNFKPEVFSTLKVDLTETDIQPPCESDGTSPPGSAQTSDCRSATSVTTEELELSALLSRGSSDAEDSLQNFSPSPIDVPQLGDRPDTPQPERSSGGNESEAYVTMSSFYQTK